ncbi:MAG: RHS repeat-associated core domain-containing protein, partial [Chloroflexi bacterium]|nr:RHS repeat-associated core domain-containing protein [Chloroflexota bacterium]
QDHLTGTATVTDASGNSAGSIKYKPYGETRLSSGSLPAQKFTGQRLDDAAGFYYYGGRYYDQGLARFISADPITPRPSDPQGLNRYSYVLNNPLRYVDPTGFEPDDGPVVIPFYGPPGPGTGGITTLHVVGPNGNWVSYNYNRGGLSSVAFNVTVGFQVQQAPARIPLGRYPAKGWWGLAVQVFAAALSFAQDVGLTPALPTGTFTVEGRFVYVPQRLGVYDSYGSSLTIFEVGTHGTITTNLEFGALPGLQPTATVTVFEGGQIVDQRDLLSPQSGPAYNLPATGGPVVSRFYFGFQFQSPIFRFNLTFTYHGKPVPVKGGDFTVDFSKVPAEIT